MRTHYRRNALALAAQATLLGAVWQPSVATAASATWSSTSDQNWTTAANWNGAGVPGASDAGVFTASFMPPSRTVNINSAVSLGALINNMSSTSSLTIGGSGIITFFGQTATVPQVGGSFTSPNIVISATSTASNATKDLTLGSTVGVVLAHAQNVIVGTQGATSGGSGQGNKITIGGTIADEAGIHAGITFLGNGNFQNEGAALILGGNNTFSGGLVIGSADGLNGGQVRVTSNGNLGTGSIVVNDQGQLIFNANGTYGSPGQLMVVNGTGLLNNTGSSGAFRSGSSSVVWAGDVQIGSSLPADGTNGFVVLSATNGNTIEVHGNFGGSGDLQKQGGGTLLLSGTCNATGATQIGNGNITVAAGSAISTGDLIMFQSSSNTGVALNLFNTLQNVGNLSSNFTQTSGVFTQFINLGTLSGSVGGQINIKQTVNKIFGYGNAVGLTSTIQGPGSVSLDASSTAALTFTGPNAYQGGTTINGGTLNLANGTTGSATGLGSVVVNAGGNLASGRATVLGSAIDTATMTGPLVVNSGGNVYPGGGNSAGSLTVGGLVSNAGSGLNFDLVGGSSASFDQIVDTGSLSFDSLASVKVFGSKLAFGSYKLINFNGGSLASGSGTLVPAVNPGGTGRTYLLTLDNTGLTLDIADTASERFWSVTGNNPAADGSGTWAAGATSFFNTNPNTPSAPYDNASNNAVIIGNGGTGATITLGGNVRVGGALVLGATTNAPGYTIGTSGSLNTLQLAGGIAASNNATINAPIVLEGSQTFTVDASHTVTINGSLAETGGAAALTKDDAGTLVLSGAGSYTGGTVINNGVLQVSTSALPAVGGVNNNAALVFSQAVNGTYSGNIAGSGSVTIANTAPSAAVTLAGTNSYTGATILQSGALAIASPSGVGTGTMLMSGGTLRADADVALPVTNRAVNLVVGTTSTIDTNGHLLTLNNILNGGGNLTKAGAGTLVIAGIHTTVVLGELAIAGGAVSIAPPSTVSYGFAASNSGGTWVGDLVIANPIELRLQGGVISGGGAIRVKPSTVQIVSRGATTIANNIILNDNASPISGFSANLGAQVSNSLTITGIISGQADVNFSGGAGIVSLGSVNTYTGATDIDNGLGGEVQLLIDNPLPTSTATHVSSTGILDLNAHNQTISSLAAGTPTATVVNGTPNSGSLAVLTIAGSASTEFAGLILDGNTSPLGLTLGTANTGTLLLSGTLNTYTGGTTINGGKLVVSTDANLGGQTGALTFGGGTLVATDSFDPTGRPLTINPGTSAIDIAAGKSVGLLGAATTSWAGGRLNVTGGGMLAIARSGGSVNVVDSSMLGVGTSSTVTVSGTIDPFTDSAVSTRHVAIVNNGSLAITAGSVVIARHTGTGTLAITGGASLTIAASASHQASTAGTVTISSGSGSTLDLTNNSFVIDYTGPVGTLVNDTRLMIKNGVIRSSLADATHRLGYGDNAVLGKTTFGGVSVDPSSLLIKFTYGGDANLDGQVDVTDLGALATSWQTSAPWTGGDFDYSGFVDVTDLGMLATNWQAGVGSPLGRGSFEAALAAVGLGGAASVPEPASIGFLCAVAVSTLARRRRRGIR